jgi:hypothetical protein
MKSFLYYIKEQEESKLKHIHHAEDRPFLHGAEGFDHAHAALMQAHGHIKSGGHSSHLTMKYDGSPALIFGRHPETGKFFVASKSAFNVNPKINYTHEDIVKNHGHAPGLMEKLHAALNHLEKVSPKTGVYQGDLMFSEGDKKETNKGVSFTPNTITYSAKGGLGDKIRKAKLGIIVHTQYHGKNLQELKADPFPDVHNFGQHEDVWHQSAEHNTKNTHYSDNDQQSFLEHMEEARKLHDTHKDTMYAATSPHHGDGNHLATYINDTVRTGEIPSAEGLQKHIENKNKKASAKLKTPAAIGRKSVEAQSHINHIETNKEHYANLLKMHHHLQQAKNVLVNTLNQHEGGLDHHIDGKRTDPEGFVINHAGQPTKLVNRAEFSRANLLKVRK